MSMMTASGLSEDSFCKMDVDGKCQVPEQVALELARVLPQQLSTWEAALSHVFAQFGAEIVVAALFCAGFVLCRAATIVWHRQQQQQQQRLPIGSGKISAELAETVQQLFGEAQPTSTPAPQPRCSGTTASAVASWSRVVVRAGSAQQAWQPCLSSVSELAAQDVVVDGDSTTADDASAAVPTSCCPSALQRDEASRCRRSRCPALRAQTAAQPPQLPKGCTTLVLWGVPKQYTPDMLVSRLLLCGYKGEINLAYLPVELKDVSLKEAELNVGYAFLNFAAEDAAYRFAAEFHLADRREKFPAGQGSKKVLQVSAARSQGLVENIRTMRSSPMMSKLLKRPEWLPRLLDEAGGTVPLRPQRPRTN